MHVLFRTLCGFYMSVLSLVETTMTCTQYVETTPLLFIVPKHNMPLSDRVITNKPSAKWPANDHPKRRYLPGGSPCLSKTIQKIWNHMARWPAGQWRPLAGRSPSRWFLVTTFCQLTVDCYMCQNMWEVITMQWWSPGYTVMCGCVVVEVLAHIYVSVIRMNCSVKNVH